MAIWGTSPEQRRRTEDALGRLRELAKGERLLGFGAEQVRAASASFAQATARGPDGIHPKTYTNYPIEASGELAELLQEVEETLTWPQQVLCAAFCLLPKPGEPDGDRPICVLSAWYRIWSKIRATEIRA